MKGLFIDRDIIKLKISTDDKILLAAIRYVMNVKRKEEGQYVSVKNNELEEITMFDERKIQRTLKNLITDNLVKVQFSGPIRLIFTPTHFDNLPRHICRGYPDTSDGVTPYIYNKNKEKQISLNFENSEKKSNVQKYKML